MVVGIYFDGLSYDQRSDGQLGEILAFFHEYIEGSVQRSAFSHDLVDIRQRTTKNIPLREHTEEIVLIVYHHKITHTCDRQELSRLVKASLVTNFSRPDGHDFNNFSLLLFRHF